MQSPLILIVDDDADILKLMQMRLNAAGYRTVLANNGMEALSVLSMQHPNLVISDLKMPGMDGLALLDEIKQRDASLPVIMLTAHGSIPDAVQATQRGTFGFLSKPFDSQELLQQVAIALKNVGLSHDDQATNNAWRAPILTRSPMMEAMLAQAKLVAATDASVFIQGESGVGKELLAKAVHLASPRQNKPFVAINCGAIPENLLESELFGHAKGAFTGAVKAHVGLFQAAEGGTLFLDEIGDMPINLQVKVLRALQERVIRAVGSTQDVRINVRLISATHRNITAEMAEGRFREDLYYRINVVTLQIPQLAERPEDIGLLAHHFLQIYTQKHQKSLVSFAPDALETLNTAAWPGNVRQLQNVIEQTVVLATTPIITNTLVQKALHVQAHTLISFDAARQQFEYGYLVKLLKLTQGNVANAAKLAQRNRTEFYKLLERHHLQAADFKSENSDL